jgi:DNA polymerase epsilon subunit 1
VTAFENNIICPNKQEALAENFYHGHLTEQETYIGGHVEAIESGVFRSDLPMRWDLDATAFDEV